MTSKVLSLEVFLTKTDENTFSRLLKEQFPQIKFIENFVWHTPNPPVYDSMAECWNNKFSDIIIIDTHILSIEEYKNTCIIPHLSGQGYLGSQVGDGVIQFLRSRVGEYGDNNCLGNGSLGASYNLEYEPETDKLVKAVWKLVRKNALKVYFVDTATGKVSEKPESRFYAFPDAAAKFNGTNGRYLQCGALTQFIAK
ncbi:hypothetical protein [Xylocopilactobacillus apicola]|uniref:Uncharacterized protein n=1 Tax=Xylocopilactobacillus apicola TaxID=2932184 RepID=A0AAU9DHC9_9LACO|nr:hypothetical protein [Xylocopilactobacillus apicola]BDR57691.1 hypothetical protein XA3_01320 [Xylocopilactobacillus apicola]